MATDDELRGKRHAFHAVVHGEDLALARVGRLAIDERGRLGTLVVGVERDHGATIDHARARKAAHKHAAAEERERRVAEKREFLAARRRERQRQHWVGARRKQLARIKGRLKGLVGSSS